MNCKTHVCDWEEAPLQMRNKLSFIGIHFESHKSLGLQVVQT